MLEENSITRHKKIIIIFTSILLPIVLIGLILIRSQNKKEINIVTVISPTFVPANSTNLPTPISDDNIPSAPPTPVPQPGDIILNGISVKNFKENTTESTENDNFILAQTSDYQIEFNDIQQEIRIFIYKEDYKLAQQNAEERLVEILGISKPNICRLFIEEYIRKNKEDTFSDIPLSLSFCYD